MVGGLLVGAGLVIIGVLGFGVSGGHPMAGRSGGLLLGVFGVNALHNLVHLAAGAVLIAAARSGAWGAKSANVVVGAGCLVLAALGLFLSDDGSGNILAFNGADGMLHLVFGVVLLVLGLGADRDVRAADGTWDGTRA